MRPVPSSATAIVTPAGRRAGWWRPRGTRGAARRAVGDRADARAHEAPDRVPDRVAHAADLPVATLVDHDQQRGTIAVGAGGGRDPRRRGRTVVEIDAFAQPTHLGARRNAVDLGQ